MKIRSLAAIFAVVFTAIMVFSASKPEASGYGTGGGSGGANSGQCNASSSDPSYSAGENPCSQTLAGYQRVQVPTTQVVPTGTASALPAAQVGVGTLPLNASGDPYTQATLNITSATTTTVVSGTAAQTVRVYAIVLTCAAAQTIDVQSTGGTSRTGGALTCASGGSVVLDPFPTGSAWWTSVSGEGIQFVTSTSGAIHGTVYYIKS